ncbi:cache domain-containing sensor histidine kinase [Paenibacillus faecalis]|uniref:cache domain-containing sensor histidine kinase n=1 Tax=Paenibacillus faecalis TaxID=2079532 RepID=UPI000D0ECC4E|nr:sensor histidine kinase [Paenibacillus faecalis]
MKVRSIRSRLIQFMLVVTTIPLLLSLIITWAHTRESVKEQTVNENVRLIYQGTTNLTNYLSNINQDSLSIYHDPNFLLNLALDPDNYRVVADIYATLQSILNTNPDIHQIYLHNNLNGQSTQITSGVPRREFRSEPFRRLEQFGDGDIAIEPVHMSHNYGFSYRPADLASRPVITFYRSITDIPSTKQLALMAIDVKLDGITTICEQLYNPDEEHLYLLDDKGVVLYSRNSDEVGSTFKDMALLNEISGKDRGYFDGSNAMSIYEKLDLTFAPWTLVKQIPHQSLYKNSIELTSINLIIAVLALLVVIFGTLWISIRITKPIKQLAAYMNQVQIGRLDVEININSPDEIGLLARQFRQMMDTINNLILREYKLELANKTNQLKVLQAQIDPHFLYNSLQSIGTLALQNNVPRIYSLLSSLANIMRYNMRNGEALVKLKDELNYLELYLDLQKQRFEDKLEVIWDIDPDTLSVPVPKMILQPIVENYFKHGMDNRANTGRMSISSRLTEEHRINIRIENTGTSIDKGELLNLQNMLQHAAENEALNNGYSIGLSNVLMRLNLYSDNSARLHIENVEPHGVAVTLEMNAWGV